MKGDFCGINSFKPNQRTLDAIKDMNNVSDMSSILDKVIRAVPFFQIFAGRKTYTWFSRASTVNNITAYDWQMFSEALTSVDALEKEQLRRIAVSTAMYSTGEDYKFWKCVQNAL